jgi:hypothetical protein
MQSFSKKNVLPNFSLRLLFHLPLPTIKIPNIQTHGDLAFVLLANDWPKSICSKLNTSAGENGCTSVTIAFLFVALQGFYYPVSLTYRILSPALIITLSVITFSLLISISSMHYKDKEKVAFCTTKTILITL